MGLAYFLDFTLAELGRVCQAEGQREGAARYLQEALALCEPMRNVEWLRQTQSILAEGDLLDGHPEQARQRLLPVLDRSADQEPDVTALLPLLAWAHLDAGDLASAETALEQAIARAWSQQMRPALANALLVQVRLAARQRRYQEAEESLEATLGCLESASSPPRRPQRGSTLPASMVRPASAMELPSRPATLSPSTSKSMRRTIQYRLDLVRIQRNCVCQLPRESEQRRFKSNYRITCWA